MNDQSRLFCVSEKYSIDSYPYDFFFTILLAHLITPIIFQFSLRSAILASAHSGSYTVQISKEGLETFLFKAESG
jgi:hypothetical protein